MIRVGIDVWIGWCPSELASPKTRPYLCTVATVIGGPFPPSPPFDERHWLLRADDGKRLYVAESLLTPFDDPGEPVTLEQEMTA